VQELWVRCGCILSGKEVNGGGYTIGCELGTNYSREVRRALLRDTATYLSCLNSPVGIVQQRRPQTAKKAVRLSTTSVSARHGETKD